MSKELDVEELEELKEEAFLQGVIGSLTYLKSLLEKNGDPKEVLEKALEEVVEIGTTAVSLLNHDICLHKFARMVLRATEDTEPTFEKDC